MPPKGMKGGRRAGAGRKRLWKSLAERQAAKGVYIGAQNVKKWVLLKEGLGFMNDSDFAAFLLDLAEHRSLPRTGANQQQAANELPETSNNTATAADGHEDAKNGNEKSGSVEIKSNSDERQQRGNETEESSADDDEEEEEDDESDDEEEDEEEVEEQNEMPKFVEKGQELPRMNVINNGEKKTAGDEQEQHHDEENDSPCEDEKDIDWTPDGFKQVRCMRRSTRAATLKSRQGVRQTRARARILTPQQPKRKRSASSDIRKAPSNWIAPSPTAVSLDEATTRLNGEKIRSCIDCSLKHPPGDCPLRHPQRITVDSPAPLLTTKDDRMSRAEATLPKILKLVTVDKGHGPSIVTMENIQRYTQFGPITGQCIEEADIHEDMDLKHIWEIFRGNMKSYVDTSNPHTSNWLRYMRPASSKSERNVSAVSSNDCLYFVTIKDVAAGTELTYWAEDPTVSWSKKKMEKTSCGGCNQKFVHPLYYRMHCMIFHDPNYSLTIRKYHCKICGIAVLGKENIMRHASEMHEGKGAYQCQYCKKFFLRLNYLDMHRTYGCKLNPRRSRPLCDLCGKKFCQPQKLKVHIRRMHSDISEVLKEFQCKSCFKLLGSRAALQRHLKEVHNKDQNIAATCDRCGKTFQNKSNLKIHMLTHSGVKPFRCAENGCTAAFTTKQCLQFHYKKVHGYTMENMPSIERCIAYTFESYSGGQGDEDGSVQMHERQMQFSSTNSIPSIATTDVDESSLCSSSMAEFPPKEETTMTSTITPMASVVPPSEVLSHDRHGEMDSLETLSLEQCAAVEVEHPESTLDDEPDVIQLEAPLPSLPPPSQPVNDHPENGDEEEQADVELCREVENASGGELHPPPVRHAEGLDLAIDLVRQNVHQEVHVDPIDKVGLDERHFDHGDVERVDSEVDLDTDLDDNTPSEHSLELDPRVDEVDDSPVSVSSHTSHLRGVDHMVGSECAHHAAMAAMSYAPLSGRLLGKDDGKEFTSEMVASMTCDFAIVRHYAASIAQNEYALQMRHHTGISVGGGALGADELEGRAEELERQDDDLGPEPCPEDLSRYELDRGELPIKVESDDLSATVGITEDLTKRRLAQDDTDELLVTPDEDDDDEVPSSQEDAAMVLAQQEHAMNQYVRHQAVLSHRDLDRLPMHSLDLSLPRSTVHLLEHLARTTSHSMEHISGRALSSSPEETSMDHLPRPSSHGNIHLGQLSFHGMDTIPRPLAHRLDHLGHIPASQGMEHMPRSASQQDVESHLSPRGLDPLSPPVPHGIDHLSRPTSHGIDGISQTHPYTLDHLSRLPPPSHGLDSFSRSPMDSLSRQPSHSMENLSRSTAHGMEFLSRLSPLPRTHRLEAIARTFTYSMEHPETASYLLQHGGGEHLSRPSSHTSPYSVAATDSRSTPHIAHSLDLSTSRNVESPQSHDTGRVVSSPSYQDCSPPTPSSSSSSYQAAATPSSSSSSHIPPPPPSPVPTSSVHPTYPTYLEYY